jgi:hypothetical protein
METTEETEFIVLLLIENNCYNNIMFSDYIDKHYDTKKINERYRELLDKFLNKYALNKAEKSD